MELRFIYSHLLEGNVSDFSSPHEIKIMRCLFQNLQGDFAGIGLDSCVIPLRHKGLFLIQTTDFFYPLVDDPYLMVMLSGVLISIHESRFHFADLHFCI